ncbi:MAG: delta 1-pyrroline-5-carboxylate synthetase, partial [Anaerolineales bacterium]
MRAAKLVLVTDVDGIVTGDPKTEEDATLIERLSAENLRKLDGRMSVDRFLGELLVEAPFNCYVV